MAQGAELRTKLSRPGRSGGQFKGTRTEKDGHTDDGRIADCHDLEPDDAALGAMERVGDVDVAVSRCPGGPGILRRLHQNHQSQRRRRKIRLETLGPGRSGPGNRYLSARRWEVPKFSHRSNGALLQTSGSDRG